jgi:hypothetical protein
MVHKRENAILPGQYMDFRKNKETVLIGFAEALSAPEVAWDLLAHGFQVMAYCRRGSSPPLRRIKEIRLIEVTPPEKDAWETVEQIRKASQLFGARVLLPLDDSSIWLCDRVSTGHDILVAGASGHNARLALNKQDQLEAAREAGFNIPETVYITEKQDLLKINQLPVVIKPADAVSEMNGKLRKGPIIFCIERGDLARAAIECDYEGTMMVQTVITGTGEGIFGLNGPAGVKKWSAHRRIRMINPLGAGSSACQSIEISDHPIKAAEKMLEKTNWPGMFMFELLRDHADRLWFMELNGRSWGSMALAVRLGLHYPAWTVMQTLDPSFIPPDSPPWKPIVCRHLGREIIHVLAVLKGKKTYKLVPNYSRMRTLREVCRFNRNEEWYNWRSGNSLLFWEDTIKNVMGKLFSFRGSH